MPRPSIDYMLERQAQMPASGGTNYRRRETATYDPDCEREPFDIAMSAINSFALWAQCSRARYLAANGMTPSESETEIPF